MTWKNDFNYKRMDFNWLLENYVVSEVGKAGCMGQRQPTDCFCSTYMPRMIFTFLNGWWVGEEYFLTRVNYMKFKFQFLRIKFGRNTATAMCF